MKGKKTTIIHMIFILALIIFTRISDGNTQSLSDSKSPEGLIPENLNIEETYQPVYGTPIGKIQLIQGKAFIIHSDDTTGYAVSQNIPVFKKDTVIALDKSRLTLELIDGSVMTMASNSKIKFTEALFDEQTKTRTSLINMALGKARFIVQKLKDFNESNFTVKTKTAIVGVRGSDFIISTNQTLTEVTTLDNTTLEITSLENLEKPPVLLQTFEQIKIESGFLPSEVISVSPEIIQEMIMEMSVRLEKNEPVNLTDTQKETAEKTRVRIQPSGIAADEGKQVSARPEGLNSDKMIIKPESTVHPADQMQSPPFPGPIKGKLDEAVNNIKHPLIDDKLLMIDDKLLKPENIPIEPDRFIVPEISDEDKIIRQEDFIRQENERIIERTAEDIKRLPDLPKPPY